MCWLTGNATFNQTEQKQGPLLALPFTWLVKVDARVRVVDCMCKVCATHVTYNMHPAAACRDSCDNPILVKSLGLQIGSHWVPLIHASNIYCDSPTGFVSRLRRSLSMEHLPCTCRVQASFRLLKMLQHIVGKVQICSDLRSVGTVLLCCSSLAD